MARGSLAMYALPESPEFPGIRNCKTIGIDLKSNEGRDIFYDLAKTADVVMESYRPGVVQRLGVDYEALKALNTEIVYVSLTSYGQDGPYRDRVGHDINFIAIGGLLGMTGLAGGPPALPGTLVGDLAAGGMAAAIGILAALMSRERTGNGQFVDVSMTDGIVAMMYMYLNPHLVHGVDYRRGETDFTGHRAWYNVYETKDGKYIAVGAFEAWFYANLCQLLERPDFAEHQFAEGEKREEILDYFRKTFLTKTRDEWMEILTQKDTCSTPVYSLDEVVTDPQLLARGLIQDMPHPVLGSVKQVASMLKLSDSPFQLMNWSTRFGQHTNEVLIELGYDEAQIDALRDEGIVG
jgi:crotonobetainyl-CoA:carnitine CoA-transferase CaiB-like acyl-CoA transferase